MSKDDAQQRVKQLERKSTNEEWMVIDVDADYQKNEPLSSQKKTTNANLNKQALMAVLSPKYGAGIDSGKEGATNQQRKMVSQQPGYRKN